MADLNLRLVIKGSNEGALAALNQVIDKARSAGAELQRAGRSGAFDQATENVDAVGQQLDRIRALAATAIGGTFLVGIARDALRAADELKGVEARLKLATTSWAEYQRTLAGVRDIAFAAGTTVAANVALINRIADPVRAMGGAQQDVLTITQAVNNSLRITNATTAEAAAATLQFAQAMGAGVLRGEELNSILENAPRLARAIADGLGVTVGELKKLGEQGALTSEQVFKAVKSQQATLAEESARLPQTIGQAWTNVGEGVKRYVSEVDKSAGATAAFAATLNTIAGSIPAIGKALADVAIVATVAFGARQAAALAAYIAAQREKIAASRLAAAEDVRHAQAQVALQAALARTAQAELAAIRVTQSYTLATNEATIAEARRAAAARANAAAQGAQAATGALGAATSAQALASAGIMARAASGAASAGRLVLGVFGGWPGIVLTALTAGALAWEYFSSKGKDASKETQVTLSETTRRFAEFSGKMGVQESAAALSELKDKAAQAREELANPVFRKSEAGKALQADLEAAERAIDRFEQRVTKFNDSLTRERGLLGIDKMKLDVGGIVDDETLKKLDAFKALYKAFTASAIGDNNRLKANALEVKAALDQLLSAAKTQAEFTGLVTRIGEALKASPSDSVLRSQLERAVEGRMQADLKTLDVMVSGLEARATRTQAFFTRASTIALGQFTQATALSRVAAELASDTEKIVRIDSNSRNAEVVVAQQTASLQVAALEQVATRKRQLIAQEKTDTLSAARDEIDAAQMTQREKLRLIDVELARGRITEAQAADQRVAVAKDAATRIAAARATEKNVDIDAARKLREVDAETARQRAAIAEALWKTLREKASEALNQYKQYAQQVIALDKSIQANRLDTAAAIGALQRSEMSPKEQLASLRDELALVQAATAEAQQAGRQDQALELLNRQKSLAQSIGGLTGEGVDRKAMISEGVGQLERIGAEADAILQEQRDTAQAAADAQLRSYREMSEAMTKIGQQITALNEQAAISIKPEIDKAALDGAIAAVQQAFAGVTVPVRVQAVGMPAGDQGQVIEEVTTSRARGGPLPGYAPHDRADNALFWGTPGEWVIQRPAVRYYGAAFIAAINAMKLPKFATGGQIGASIVDRLRVPALPSTSSHGASRNLTLNIGGEKFAVSAGNDTIDRLQRYVTREALRKGGRA